MSHSDKSSTISAKYDNLYSSQKTELKALDLNRWPRNRWEALVRLCPDKVNRALEIGCGNGEVLYNIAPKCRELVGVELSEFRCDVARKNLEGLSVPCELLSGNLEDGIEKPDGEFDVILWADVIEHVVDIFVAMKEVTRLLAPGGFLITATPNVAYFPRRLSMLLGEFPGTACGDQGFATREGEMYDGGHLHYLTFGTLEQFYLMYGVKPLSRMGFGSMGRLHHLWPPLLSGSACVVGQKIGTEA